MSKKLIAGLGTAAALGIAALPLAGVFAVPGAQTGGDWEALTDVRVRVIDSVQCQSNGADDSDFVWLGQVAAGVIATGDIVVTGSTNSEDGIAITGSATNLDLGTLDTPTGDDANATNVFTKETTTPDAIVFDATGNADGKWWVGGVTGTGAGISGTTITLAPTSVVGDVTYNLTANARPSTTNTPGIYQGSITWTCTVND